METYKLDVEKFDFDFTIENNEIMVSGNFKWSKKVYMNALKMCNQDICQHQNMLYLNLLLA